MGANTYQMSFIVLIYNTETVHIETPVSNGKY